MKLFACALLLVLAACTTAGSGTAPDVQNPLRPQAGPPFPYNTYGW